MSNETYWDSIQIIKDPKKKEIAASFVQTDEGAVAGSESPCVRILAPDDYFPYKDNSGHYYIAYIYEPLPVDIVGTVTHTTGGICEANSIIVPTEMDATSTFTIPRGSTEVRVDLTLNQVLVDVSQTPDYKAAYTATLTSVTNGRACGEPQCIQFWAGTSVIPPDPDPGPEPEPEAEIPPADDQFPECGGQDCASLSSYYLSVVGGGNVVSFLDVTGNGNLSTATWPKNNDVYQDPPYDDQGYNTHRCADPEGNLSDYYYAGFSGYNFNYAYSPLSNQMETYIGSNFCRAQSKAAPAWNGIAPLGNLRNQGHLLTWGSVRGLDGLAGIGSGGANPGSGLTSYYQNAGFIETTFHFLVSVDSSPSSSDVLNMGLNYRASLSTYKADTGPILDPTTGVYSSIYRPSGSIYVQLRGDGTMRFLAPGANDEVGRWVVGTPAANSVHLVSVRVTGGIINQFVDRANNTTFGSCEIDGNIEVLTEADTANAYYRKEIGGGVMNGSEDDFWSAYDYQGEPLQGVQFTRQSSNGVNSALLAISTDRTFDSLFRRSFTDYALPDYCSRIP